MPKLPPMTCPACGRANARERATALRELTDLRGPGLLGDYEFERLRARLEL
jgi:hypothetical protein